jgi:ABC-type multidrug transport system ATPase subunit
MIEVTHLTKRFGSTKAVDDLSFTVQAGQAVTFWGANGAGKTTALRCLLNLIPFEGTVTVDGLNVKEYGKEARHLVGFVPQELSFHDDMTVQETILFYARLKKVEHDHDFIPLLTRLQMIDLLYKRVGDLSGGMKQRLALTLALLSDPPILLLDEPTVNLDIRAREDFLLLLLELKRTGKTMVFSSHRLEEVTALADRVLLLEAGQLVVDSPPHELEQRLGWETTLHLYLRDNGIDSALQVLSDRGLPVNRNGRGVRVQVAPGEKGKVLSVLYEAGVEVMDFSVE